MIARLRASAGAGFDLAQPSQDRVTGPQRQFHIYRPIDLSRIKTDLFLPEMLESAKVNTTVDGKQYGVPFLWGAEGMVVNTRHAAVTDYLDLCKPELHGKTALRLVRPTLIAFAFAMGKDPFALYADPAAYSRMLDEVEKSLIACKRNLHFVFEAQGQIQDAIRAGDVFAAMLWDAPAWELGRENRFVRFINPKSGGLAWLMTSVLPAKGQNDEAAYAWINYTMRPEIAAR
ncbi:MAG: extracellular solute-binding protein, partial [Proteobacteria bacterium]|nr:extracellular solute-binding protein [Pseudomonadota bacterium]